CASPYCNGTHLRRVNVHSLKSGLACHFSARRAVYSPVLGSTSSRVSRNGSYCRWSGRLTIQKRLLSSNPADANTSFWTFASCADPGVSAVSRVSTNASSSPSARGTRLIEYLLRTFFCSHVSQLGVQVISEPIPQQVQGEHRQHDGQPGEHRDPPGRDDQLSPIRDHETPRRGRTG